MGDLLKGKRGLVMGVANDRSIAWGIAKALAGEGAELAFTYQGDMFAERVRPLAAQVGSDLLIDVDVTNDDSLDAAFGTLADRWGKLDFLVHAIAFSNKDELTGRFVNTSRENFKNSLDISCYSLIEVARRAHPLMAEGGSIITLTYGGSNRVTPFYNVMGVAKAALEATVRYLANDLGPDGIRVNAISPGEIDTAILSPGTDKIVEKLPMQRLGKTDEVAKAIYFLCTDASSYVTGAELHINGGQHV